MRSARLAMVAAVLVGVLPASLAAQRQSDPAASPAFWRMLGDTTLERLVSVALDANRDLAAAEARVRAARADRTGAALELTPSVTAALGYSRQRLATAALPGVSDRLPDQDIWDGTLNLSWELDVFGRNRRSLQGRNALLTSAEEDVADLQVVLLTELARTYFEMRGAQDRLEVARRNAENQRRTLELTVSRLEGGRGNALDMERARAQLSSTLAAIPTLEAAVAASAHRLAALVGREPAATLRELEAAEAVPITLPAELPIAASDETVRRRPDVRSAASRVAASRAFHGAARAAYLPRLSIGGVAGYTANQFDALGNSGTPRYAVGPVVSWPFLDLGRVKAGADAARAGEAEAAARYEQALLDARQELETARTAYGKARDRLQHLEDAAAASQRATDLAQLRFEEGGTDFLEVLDAERRQLEAQDRLAAGRIEALGWLLATFRAAGGMDGMR